jgi:MFS family permease
MKASLSVEDRPSVGSQLIQQSMEDPPARWVELSLLSVAILLSMTTWFSAAAVLPQLKSEWHLASGLGSFLTISVQLGFVFGAIVSAGLNLSDIVGPRRIFFLGSVAAAIANLVIAFSGGPAVAIAFRFLTGFSLAMVYPPGLKAISTWFKRERGTALGVMVGALTLGSALPYFLNAIALVHWQLVIFGTSVLTVIGGLIAEFVATDGPLRFPRATFDPRQAPLAFANRGVRLASLGYFGHMWELYAMWAWFFLFFTQALGFNGGVASGRAAALGTFAVIGVGAVGCLVGGVMGDRWGRTITTIVCMSCSGCCCVLIGLAAYVSVPLTLLIGLVWGFWIVADSAQFSTMVTETADQRYVGTAVTLQLAIGFTLTVLTIYLIPVISSSLSWRWAFAFLAPGPLVGVIAMMRLRRAPESALIAGGRR